MTTVALWRTGDSSLVFTLCVLGRGSRPLRCDTPGYKAGTIMDGWMTLQRGWSLPSLPLQSAERGWHCTVTLHPQSVIDWALSHESMQCNREPYKERRDRQEFKKVLESMRSLKGSRAKCMNEQTSLKAWHQVQRQPGKDRERNTDWNSPGSQR